MEGEYIYHAPENVSIEQAKRVALERAMTKALADQFGTILSKSSSTIVKNENDLSDIYFYSIGSSDVKGEWLETVGEPTYDISYVDGMLVVNAYVKGKGREIVSPTIDLYAKVLCNGTEERFENDRFRENDEFYVLFRSPVSGYLAIYLIDAANQAFCLLPYSQQTEGIYSVKANVDYLFFSIKDAPEEERSLVEEYGMTCDKNDVEHNLIYVVFSPNPFYKANDSQIKENLPRQLSYEDFQRWQVKQRKHDKDMNMLLIPISITK